MRIIGGSLGGRSIEQPKTDKTRPMSQKVRAAIFDILGDIADYAVLDLYAGSGALGLEAVSRGAAWVVLIESNPKVVAVINKNIAELGLEGTAQTIGLPVGLGLNAIEGLQFNLIIADPPYAALDVSALNQAAEFLTGGGVLVVSHSSKIASPELESLELVQAKTYGDTALSFYKK